MGFIKKGVSKERLCTEQPRGSTAVNISSIIITILGSHRQSTCRKTGHGPPWQLKINSRNIQAERAEMSRSFKVSISLSIQREEIIHRVSAELGSGKKNTQLTVTSSMTPLSEGSSDDRKFPPKRTWCKNYEAADCICFAIGKWPQRKMRL